MNLDEIGPWSEIKLDILRDYAAPYSRILKSNGFHHGYIDAFSGPGLHVRKAGGEEVLGRHELSFFGSSRILTPAT